MPETHDPIRLLETFGAGVDHRTPLDPAEVRRLGDRRRHRRNALAVTAAALLVAGAIVPAALLGGHGDESPPITRTPPPGPVVTYPGNGVVVHDSTQTGLLEGAPADFKAFVGRLADQLGQQGGSQCPEADHGITVRKVSDAGYALGAVNECGGYVALWVRTGAQWKEALGTQDEWRCGDLTRVHVPESFAGQCHGPEATFGPTEDQGLRLGMTGDQVRAAGGTVVGPGGACQGVVPPGLKPQKEATLGYLSAMPGKGVVALYAQPDQVTPEGISQGSSRAAVERAYPEGHLDPMHGAWVVPIDAHSHYRFDLDHGSVRLVSLEAEGPQDCYE